MVSDFRRGLAFIPTLVTFVPVLVGATNGKKDRSSIAIVHTLSLNSVRFNSVFGMV